MADDQALQQRFCEAMLQQIQFSGLFQRSSLNSPLLASFNDRSASSMFGSTGGLRGAQSAAGQLPGNIRKLQNWISGERSVLAAAAPPCCCCYCCSSAAPPSSCCYCPTPLLPCCCYPTLLLLPHTVATLLLLPHPAVAVPPSCCPTLCAEKLL